MNLKFMGDALDHWKGSLFEFLSQLGTLQNFGIEPMASDLREWTEADYAIYARVLRVQPSQVIRHQRLLTDRKEYFAEISHLGDMFLDPDTGVKTSQGRSVQHLGLHEIRELADEAPNRLLAIYQHGSRPRRVEGFEGKAIEARVDQVIRAILTVAGDFTWCSYESGTVAMLFLSRNQERVQIVQSNLVALLGRHAEGRVRPLPRT